MSPIFTCKTDRDFDVVLSLHDVNVVRIESSRKACVLFRGHDEYLHFNFTERGAELLFAAFIKYKEFEAAEQIKQLGNLYSASK